jgi:hypothetical protein
MRPMSYPENRDHIFLRMVAVSRNYMTLQSQIHHATFYNDFQLQGDSKLLSDFVLENQSTHIAFS